MKKLDKIAKKWEERLAKALVRVENARRAEAETTLLPESALAYVPSGPSVDLLMLNLKVWSMRYSVSPEFVVDALTRCYAGRRKVPGKSAVRAGDLNGNSTSLGISAGLAGSASARRAVEDAVSRAFPNGENRRALRARDDFLMRGISGAVPETAVERYVKKMSARHKERLTMETPSSRRFRGR